MKTAVVNLLHGALDLLLPRHCILTGRPLLPVERACVAPEVLREAALTGADYCTRCGAPQGKGVGVIGVCGRCERAKTGYSTAEIAAVGDYRGVLREICVAHKFAGAIAAAEPLAAWLTALLIDRGISESVELVCPVPLHPFRELSRGYNQSALIARSVAKALELRYEARLLQRLRNTDPQARLSASQRAKNIEGAFSASRRGKKLIEGARVLLVDDVMTTGATLRAAAKALKEAGAKSVHGAVVARAALDEDA